MNETFKTKNENNSDVAALVIAAGYSSRMGDFKPLLKVGEKSALAYLLDSIISSGIASIHVVTGHNSDKIEEEIKRYKHINNVEISETGYEFECQLSLKTIYNKDYENGMFSSIKTGVREVSKMKSISAALLFPVDVPLVSSETIKGLTNIYRKSGMPTNFALPRVSEKNGHPLLIPKGYFAEVLNYDGDGGLKAIRQKHEEDMIVFTTDDIGALLDMDNPEEYDRLIKYYESKK